MIYIGDHNYLNVLEFLDSEIGEPLRPKPNDYTLFHKSLVEILKHLHTIEKLEVMLPEFDIKNNKYTGVFSPELKKIIKFDNKRYFKISNVFIGLLEIKNVTTQKLDFHEKRTPADELEINIGSQYKKHVPDKMIRILNRNYWHARIRWARRVNEFLQDNLYDCRVDSNNFEFEKLATHKFGIEYFVNYAGKVLKKTFENAHESGIYQDLGVLYINENGKETLSNQKDIDELKIIFDEEVQKSPLKTPNVLDKQNVNKGKKEDVISHIFKIAINERKLKITKKDIRKLWTDLPEDHGWKLSGTPKAAKNPDSDENNE